MAAAQCWIAKGFNRNQVNNYWIETLNNGIGIARQQWEQLEANPEWMSEVENFQARIGGCSNNQLSIKMLPDFMATIEAGKP